MAGGSRTQHLFVLMFLCLKMRALCRFLGGHVGTAPTVGMIISRFFICLTLAPSGLDRWFSSFQHDRFCCFVISRRFLGGPTPPLQLG